MGISVSWTAVRGKSPEAVLAAHGLRPTGASTRDWPTRQAPFGWARFGEWTLVFSRAFTGWSRRRFVDESAKADPFLSSLSMGCELVACFIEEHVMYSRAAFWKDGSMRWSVAHEGGDVGRDHLQFDGEPPASLKTLEADARAAQEAEEGVDYVFDVPTGLVRELTGFRYEDDELTLAVLEPVPVEKTKRSLLARLLGRG